MKQVRFIYWRMLLHRLWKKSRFRWANYWLSTLFLVALFGRFIANDIPLYCKDNGVAQYPVLQESFAFLGFKSVYNAMTDWEDVRFTDKVMPPIPYNANHIDLKNSQYKSPFGKQDVDSRRYRHWLGTDKIGRDVLAGLINGARVSMFVGIVSVLIAIVLGVFLGGISGYYGNKRLRWTIWKFLLIIVMLMAMAWMMYVLPMYFSSGWVLLPALVVIIVVFQLFRKVFYKQGRIAVPVDGIVMRGIEFFRVIPNILIVLILSLILPPSLISIACILGLALWPSIARFVRAEMLKIRDSDYLIAARMQNIPHKRILFRYAIPNALGPAFLAITLGFSQAVLAESTLSYLGIGLPVDVVSWGQLLALSNQHLAAWWLAVFPGLAIFFTLLAVNQIGKSILEEMNVES